MNRQCNKSTKLLSNAYIPFVAALLVALGIQPSQAVVSFDTPPVFPATGASPNSLYSYDLNVDGAWDLVWISSDDNTVSVTLNNGSGQFPTRTVYATGLKPVALQVTQIDGKDGYDLAVVNHDDDSISVFINNGDGTFKAKVDTPTGHQPIAISSDSVNFASGNFDLNQDAKLDIVVSNEGDNTLSVLLGNGDGTFNTKPPLTVAGKPGAIMVGPMYIVQSDLLDDVVVLRPDDNIMSLYENDGTGAGTFKAPVDYDTGSHPSSLMWGFSKRNGNNVSVMVTNQGDNTFSVFVPTGNTPPGLKPKVDFPTGTAPVLIPQPDWNGLGYPINLDLPKGADWTGGIDAVTVNQDGNSLSVSLNDGKGNFAPHTDYATGGQPNSLGMGDYNGDGTPDFIVLNGADNNFTELKGNGDGTFHKAMVQKNDTGAGPSAVVKGDFNGDGKTDLAVANTTANSVSILLGNGDNTFASKVDVAVGQGPNAIASGDVNGDGNNDLAVTLSHDGSVVVLIGDGQGGFTDKGFDSGTGLAPSDLALQDLNGDALLDLIVINSGSNNVSVLIGEGDGNFQSKTDFVVGTVPKALALADLNGDGNIDVAVTNSSANAVSILLGDGHGVFAKTATDSPTGAAPQDLVTGDIDADGKADIAVSNGTDNTVSVLLGNGDGTFKSKTDFATGTGPKGLDLLDLNFDHKPDLAVANSTANSVSVLENIGNGMFSSKVDFVVGQMPVAVLIGDIDTDIKPDVVVVNHDSNNVQILPNSTIAGVYLLPSKYLSFGAVGAGGVVNRDLHLTNNGTADLVISNVAITPSDNYALLTNSCSSLLGVGQSCTFHFRYTAPTQLGSHDAVFSFNGSDTSKTHQVTLHGETTESSADLGLTMTASPTSTTVSGLIKYTLEVSNYGPNKASTVIVTDTLPTGGVWFRTDGAPCTQTGNQVQCNIGDIDVGTKTTFDIWVAPTVAGKLTNSAKASSALPDPNPHDNVASRVASITALNLKGKAFVDLSLTLKGLNGNVGQTITYQAKVKNTGPQSASNVIVSIPVPAGASFISDGSDVACSAANSTVICQIASLAKSASKNFTIAFSYSTAKTYILSGKVFATEGDKSIKNNVAQVKTRVR